MGMGTESSLLNGAGACSARDLCGAFPEALPTEKCHGTSWACSPGGIRSEKHGGSGAASFSQRRAPRLWGQGKG